MNSTTSTSFLVALGLTALLLAGCNEPPERAAPPPPAVTVDRPDVREVTVFKSYPATLQGINEVDIRARVSGYLVEANFREGRLVEAGDHLFTIEPEPYELAVVAAQADLERAEAGRELAESRLKRLEEALRSNAVSEIEVDIASAELAQAIASVGQAEARLQNARLDLGYTVVDAPITGRVSLAEVSAGNLVGYAEPTVITTIVDDSTIEAYFEIPERDVIAYLRGREDGKVSEYITSLQLGLQLADHSEYALPGTIDFMDNRVDPLTRTIRLRAVPQSGCPVGLRSVRLRAHPRRAESRQAGFQRGGAGACGSGVTGHRRQLCLGGGCPQHRRAPHGSQRRHCAQTRRRTGSAAGAPDGHSGRSGWFGIHHCLRPATRPRRRAGYAVC